MVNQPSSNLEPRTSNSGGILGRALGAVVACMLAFPIPLRAKSREETRSRPSEVEQPPNPVTQPHWDRVKGLFARGAYREAIGELDAILAVTPDDPLAQAYHRLCERRLRGGGEFEQLTPEQLSALQARLQREQQQQPSAAKARERSAQAQIKAEQARWDAQIRQYQRLAQRRETSERKAREREEARRVRALRRAGRRAPSPPPQPSSTEEPAKPPPGAAAQQPPPEAPPAVAVTEGEQPAPEASPPAAGPPASSAPVSPSEAGPENRPSRSPAPTPPEAGETREQSAHPPASEQALDRHPSDQDRSASAAPASNGSEAEAPTAEEGAEEGQETSGSAGSSQISWPPPTSTPDITQIYADQMTAFPDRQLARATGHVRVVFRDGTITADEMTLFTDTQDVYAQGHVRLERGLDVFQGEMVHVNAKTKKVRALGGTAYRPPWYEHGRVIESIAEGVTRLHPGYLTSCDFDPPHFRLQGRDVRVFAEDKLARGRNVSLFVERLPVLYLPWLTAADRQTPFFLVPGKKKPWEQFALMGYRYEWPVPGHRGALRWDWRRAFGWGFGVDHRFESADFGNGLAKLYYNEEQNMRRRKEELPKGAKQNRYRVLWRHTWRVLPDTTMVTDYQKYSDVDYRRELLFREEYTSDDVPESFVSLVTSDPNFLLSAQVKKRTNRFQSVTEELPSVDLNVVQKQIPGTNFFSDTSTSVSNIQSKTAHSDKDTDAVRLSWFQQLNYAMNWFRPVLLTPKMGVLQTYYNKDKQGGDERIQGDRHLVSGQFSAGTNASLKLFRVFPATTNLLGLNLHWLRHVLTPTIAYQYTHKPTVDNSLLSFPLASGPANTINFGLENKLQTKRPVSQGKFQSVDLARITTGVPYTFRGIGNKQGGRVGDWGFDVELFPWTWMRLESDWSYPSHFLKGSRDERVTAWNLDLILVGGGLQPLAQRAPGIQTAVPRPFEPGRQTAVPLLPQGQWYLGLGHRYTYNSRTEEVIQFDWRLSEKWQLGTFHRITWKEVAGGQKRFNNLREVQYTLTRDLHDWLAQAVYRVDREFGEELFFTMTLKAYPDMPIDLDTSYHQPKIGSQSSPFSPIAGEHPPAPK